MVQSHWIHENQSCGHTDLWSINNFMMHMFWMQVKQVFKLLFWSIHQIGWRYSYCKQMSIACHYYTNLPVNIVVKRLHKISLQMHNTSLYSIITKLADTMLLSCRWLPNKIRFLGCFPVFWSLDMILVPPLFKSMGVLPVLGRLNMIIAHLWINCTIRGFVHVHSFTVKWYLGLVIWMYI